MFNFISDFKGWKPWEYLWLVLAVGVTGIASYGGTWLDGICAITNVVCVLLVAKGRLTNYWWGLVGVITYGIVSYNAHLYGNAALNILYYLPMQFYGLWIWFKNTQGDRPDVDVKFLTKMEWIFCIAALWVATYIGSFVLAMSNDPFPMLDSFTTVGSVLAMWLMVRRNPEQWIVWFFVDIVTTYLWWATTAAGERSYAMMAMWVVFLLNALYGSYKWFIVKDYK